MIIRVPSYCYLVFFLSNSTTKKNYTLSLHDALPISGARIPHRRRKNSETNTLMRIIVFKQNLIAGHADIRSEEHTSELQSRGHLVCRLLLEKKNIPKKQMNEEK